MYDLPNEANERLFWNGTSCTNDSPNNSELGITEQVSEHLEKEVNIKTGNEIYANTL